MYKFVYNFRAPTPRKWRPETQQLLCLFSEPLFTPSFSASQEEKALLGEIYGLTDDANVARVKDLYHKLPLKEKFQEYCTKTYQDISGAIAEDKSGLPKETFSDFLDAIHKRNK